MKTKIKKILQSRYLKPSAEKFVVVLALIFLSFYLAYGAIIFNRECWESCSYVLGDFFVDYSIILLLFAPISILVYGPLGFLIYLPYFYLLACVADFFLDTKKITFVSKITIAILAVLLPSIWFLHSKVPYTIAADLNLKDNSEMVTRNKETYTLKTDENSLIVIKRNTEEKYDLELYLKKNAQTTNLIITPNFLCKHIRYCLADNFENQTEIILYENGVHLRQVTAKLEYELTTNPIRDHREFELVLRKSVSLNSRLRLKVYWVSDELFEQVLGIYMGGKRLEHIIYGFPPI